MSLTKVQKFILVVNMLALFFSIFALSVAISEPFRNTVFGFIDSFFQ